MNSRARRRLRRANVQPPIPCVACATPGVCFRCTGTGRAWDQEDNVAVGWVNYPVCKSCEGNGKCRFCRGRGVRRPDDVAEELLQ